jgi:hypothetical protein
MATQVRNGKAFEFLVAHHLTSVTGISFTQNPSYFANQSAHGELRLDAPTLYNHMDEIALNYVVDYVKRSEGRPLPEFFAFNSDMAGAKGDPRDIVAEGDKWFGISCKHNNPELKSNRTHRNYDFTKVYGVNPDQGASIRSLYDQFPTDERRFSSWGGKYNAYDEWVSSSVNLINESEDRAKLANTLGKFIFGSEPYFKFAISKKGCYVEDYTVLDKLNFVDVVDIETLPMRGKTQANKFNFKLLTNTGHACHLQVRVKNGDTRMKSSPQLKSNIIFVEYPEFILKDILPSA